MAYSTRLGLNYDIARRPLSQWFNALVSGKDQSIYLSLKKTEKQTGLSRATTVIYSGISEEVSSIVSFNSNHFWLSLKLNEYMVSG